MSLTPHYIQHHGNAGIAVTATIDEASRPGTGYAAGQGSGAHDVRCLVATQQSEVYSELLQSIQKCTCCALHAFSLPYIGECLVYKWSSLSFSTCLSS